MGRAMPDLMMGRDGGRIELDDKGEPVVVLPTQDLVNITVLVTGETVAAYPQTGARPQTQLEVSIVVVSELKDPEKGAELRHFIFGFIEQILFNPNYRKLPHPETGAEAAEDVRYGDYEFVLEPADDSVLQAGSAVQTWNITPQSNQFISIEAT